MLISRAKTAGRLQRVLETHRGMPPVEHDRGVRQRLALQPPQTGIAVAALSVDHLAGNHLKVTLVLAVPAADIAAIKTDHDGFGRLCHRLYHFRGARLHYRLTGL